MAVRIDIDALLDSLPTDIRDEALTRPMRLRSLRSSNGGARAAVITPSGQAVDCWIGVRGGELAADCECRAEEAGGSLCAHAVLVLQAAVEADLPWSLAPMRQTTFDRPSGGGPDSSDWAEIAANLTHRELITLVAEQAAHDRAFASALLKTADLLGPPGGAEITLVRNAIRDALAVESGYQWDLHDIAKTGYRLAEELTLLAERPATPEALQVAEEAIEAWDGHLYAVLSQDYETYETEPCDIGDRIAAAHLALCESLQPDPLRLADDLARLEALAEIESSIDATAYRHLLGPAGIAAHKEAINELRRTRGW